MSNVELCNYQSVRNFLLKNFLQVYGQNDEWTVRIKA